MNLVKKILKESVSDQAIEIAAWSPRAFQRGITMQSNDYSGSPTPENFDLGGAIKQLADLHNKVADGLEAQGQTGSARWHRQVASRLK